MDKYCKLAQLIKLAGKEISKDSINKEINIGYYLGLNDNFNKIICTDDSGFRDICVYTLSDSNMNECVQIYTENADYKDDKEIWKYRSFPPVTEIASLLKKVASEEPLIPYGKNNCDDDRYWYSEKNKDIVRELARTVNTFADKIASDKRTAREIFEQIK